MSDNLETFFFPAEDSPKKRTKTCLILVKTNSFVCFLGESSAWQFAFKINCPLTTMILWWYFKKQEPRSCQHVQINTNLWILLCRHSNLDWILCADMMSSSLGQKHSLFVHLIGRQWEQIEVAIPVKKHPV